MTFSIVMIFNSISQSISIPNTPPVPLLPSPVYHHLPRLQRHPIPRQAPTKVILNQPQPRVFLAFFSRLQPEVSRFPLHQRCQRHHLASAQPFLQITALAAL